MNSRVIIIPLIISFVTVGIFQTLITIDCLKEKGQPLFLDCVWVFVDFVIPVSYADVPFERVPISSFGIYSMEKKMLDKVEVGQQIMLRSDIENVQEIKQSLVYGVQVFDQDQAEIFADWAEITLEPKSSSSSFVSWVPDDIGNYTALATVWESMDNPTAFSAVWEIEFEVISEDGIRLNSGMVNNPYHGIAPPLKQMQSGIKFHNVECREGLQLVYKKTGNMSACVTIFTEIELVVRGWATDSRVMLGCTGERVQKCYPEDTAQYRNDLYEYYFGDGKGLPSSDSFDFDSLHTENACTDKPWICYGMFDNGTKTRIDCDYPLHGCGVKSFDSYKTDDDIPQWKKYITVSASNVDHSKIPDSLPVYEIDDLSDNIMIETLLAGADGCKNEIEVCSISRGISVDTMYSFGISVTDSDQYSVTLNEEQAQELMSQIQWTIQDNSVYSVVSYNNEYYLLVLSTFDNIRTPDVAMRLIGVSSDPATLKRYSILEYQIQLDTWATYGADAEITLDSMNSARDSGIKTWVEPSTIIVPERSSVNATLFVQASETARDGIYDIRIGGKANGNNAGLHCGHTDCPTVQIGDSDWSIRTFGSNSGMGIGSGKSPENTSLEIELNKKEFFQGETVEIRAYLANNGTHPIVLDEPMNILIKAIRADSKGYYSHFYGIDARNESGNSITIEPGTKALLVRPFYWDQMTFENLDEEYRVEEGSRKITATLVAGEHTWKDNTWFEIK